jgi:hypothetical protein
LSFLQNIFSSTSSQSFNFNLEHFRGETRVDNLFTKYFITYKLDNIDSLPLIPCNKTCCNFPIDFESNIKAINQKDKENIKFELEISGFILIFKTNSFSVDQLISIIEKLIKQIGKTCISLIMILLIGPSQECANIEENLKASDKYKNLLNQLEVPKLPYEYFDSSDDKYKLEIFQKIQECLYKNEVFKMDAEKFLNLIDENKSSFLFTY